MLLRRFRNRPAPTVALSASVRTVFATVLATATLAAAACVQPMKLAPNDASTVLAHRTITAPDPSTPGTLAVKRLYYGNGKDRNRAEYRDSVTYKTGTVDASPYARMEPASAKSRKKYWGFDNTAFPLNARVWYPDAAGPFPLVLVVHGNHNMKEFSDPGYAWLGEFLASRGFVVASIDENFLNGAISGENDARGWMLLKHLEVFRALNDSTGKPLAGKIDMKRIALMGHSRGGEAVAVAGAFNRLPSYPDDATRTFNFNFDIKALVAIAPVDGQYRPADRPTPVADYNYLVIHGSHDGDVSNFSGLSQYQRITFAKPGFFKSAIWMYRANHGQWNTVWNEKDNGVSSGRFLNLDALVSGEDQRKFGRTVIGAFLETSLRGQDAYRAMFRDHRAAGDWLPPTLYLTRYADSDSRFLATFDEDVDVTTGSVPGVRITTDSLSSWREGDAPSRTRATANRGNVATVGWNNTPIAPDTTKLRGAASISVSVPDSVARAWNVGRASALLVTVGSTSQTPGPRRMPRDTTKRDTTKKDTTAKPAAKPAPKPAAKPAKPAPKDSSPPDFSVELEDAAGQKVKLPLSTFGAVRPPVESYVYRRKGRDAQRFGNLAEPVMQTYVAPFARFAEANPRFDASTLRRVRLVFDIKKAGAVVLDDIGITRMP